MRSVFASVLAAVSLVATARAGELSEKELGQIGRKVWQNECGGTVDGLTSWNAGENFASLGIGHFIWYPAGVNGPFDESFPTLLGFFKELGVSVPGWLKPGMDCPWKNRAEFEAEFRSPRMKELRGMLAETVNHQAAFLARRSREALAKMLDAAPRGERENVERQYARLSASGAGTFALIDYVNFKGEGVLPTERYKGEGWGLLQVLSRMRGSGPGATSEFSEAAKEVLTKRVRNAPPERNEERWLPGWKNRVSAYAGG